MRKTGCWRGFREVKARDPRYRIVAAALTATLTSKNGNKVPMPTVPTAAMPNAIHVVQETTIVFSSAFSTAAAVFPELSGGVFTATAVAAAALPLLNFVEIRLPGTGAGVVVAVAAAGTASLSMNMTAMTRR